jgi:serine/threonine protein kinase
MFSFVQVKNQLVDIHRKCRDRIPSNRPTASRLLHTYKDVLKKLELQPLQENNKWKNFINNEKKLLIYSNPELFLDF